MSLDVIDVTRIAKDAARATSPALDVVGVMLRGGAASNYVEILINITGGRTAPSRLALGVFRGAGEEGLWAEIALKLKDHFGDNALAAAKS